jgi:phenylacetic acid degradation operon negative regulatory protein
VADLLTLMRDLGVDAAVVRAAVTRMKQGGLLINSSRAAQAGYALSPQAWQILDEGDRRILAAREPADLSTGWVLVVFSIPESERARRHLIRSRLTWLGFGSVTPGVWIAPRKMFPEVESLLTNLDLDDYVELFEVQYRGLEASQKLVRKCWDLKRLRSLYVGFIERWDPVLARWSRPGKRTGQEAFIDYVAAISDWRKLPYLDPGLPSGVLPDTWEGQHATRVYFSLLSRIDQPAFDHVRAIASGPRGGRKGSDVAAATRRVARLEPHRRRSRRTESLISA